MNLEQLTATFKARADDRATVGQLWADSEITDFLNAAEVEACERGLLITDRFNADVCQLAIVTGTREYVLDSRVIDVKSARVRDQTRDMRRSTDDELYACSHSPGFSQHFAVYEQGSTLYLVLDREPAADGFIDLTVYRRPMEPMVAPYDEPEIGTNRHLDLIYWALYLAFDTRDADAGEPGRSSNNFDRFEQAFGAKIDANVRRKQLRHRPPVTRPECF